MAARQEVICRIGRHPLSSTPRKDDLPDVYIFSAEACFTSKLAEPFEALTTPWGAV